MIQELGITKEDILDKAAEKLLESISVEEDLAYSIDDRIAALELRIGQLESRMSILASRIDDGAE